MVWSGKRLLPSHHLPGRWTSFIEPSKFTANTEHLKMRRTYCFSTGIEKWKCGEPFEQELARHARFGGRHGGNISIQTSSTRRVADAGENATIKCAAEQQVMGLAEAAAEGETWRRLAVTAIAVERYRERHGEYPTTRRRRYRNC